jgi:hypothetical protein
MQSPRELWEKLRQMGVTHVVWPGAPMGLEAWSDEAVFYGFVRRYVIPRGSAGGLVIGELPPTPPPAEPFGAVALQGCGLAHRVSLPEVDANIWIATPPATAQQKAENQRGAEFIFVEIPCRAQYPSVAGYELVTARNGWKIWARRR